MSSKRFSLLAVSLTLIAFGCRTENSASEAEGGAGASSESPDHGARGGSGGSGADGGSATPAAGAANDPGEPTAGVGGAGPGENEGGAGGAATTPDAGGAGGNPGSLGDAGAASSGEGEPANGAARRFFLPTPSATNTVAPKVVVDRDGGLHAAYPAYAGGRAFYSYCDKNCAGPEALKVVEFAIGSSIANVSIALTAAGKPRLVLSEFDKVYFASCDSACTTLAGWTVTPVIDHDNQMEVTGQALALDPLGHPRFLMHRYVATLGIGQGTPETVLASCDSGCSSATGWSFHTIATEIWQYPEFRSDSQGRLHVAAAKVVFQDNVPVDKLGSYFRCEGACDSPASWKSVPLALLYEDTVVKPSLSLALTATGDPRVALLIEDDDQSTPDGRYLAYAECSGACELDDWHAVLISENRAIRNGVSLALDGARPRVAFTLDYNIGIYQCDQNCTDSDWQLKEVEFARNLAADDIFLFPSCSVGAWFLDSPSVAITGSGALRVGYRAYDVSGAAQPPLDPSKPRCKTGIDFTWSRLAALPSL